MLGPLVNYRTAMHKDDGNDPIPSPEDYFFESTEFLLSSPTRRPIENLMFKDGTPWSPITSGVTSSSSVSTISTSSSTVSTQTVVQYLASSGIDAVQRMTNSYGNPSFAAFSQSQSNCEVSIEPTSSNPSPAPLSLWALSRQQYDQVVASLEVTKSKKTFTRSNVPLPFTRKYVARNKSYLQSVLNTDLFNLCYRNAEEVYRTTTGGVNKARDFFKIVKKHYPQVTDKLDRLVVIAKNSPIAESGILYFALMMYAEVTDEHPEKLIGVYCTIAAIGHADPVCVQFPALD
jgi:hypothetical protein